MTNPVQMYGGGSRSSDDGTRDAPIQTAGHGYVPTVAETPIDPVIDETMVDPGPMESHVTDLFNAAHETRMGVHNANCEALGRENIGSHDFPSNTGH